MCVGKLYIFYARSTMRTMTMSNENPTDIRSTEKCELYNVYV